MTYSAGIFDKDVLGGLAYWLLVGSGEEIPIVAMPLYVVTMLFFHRSGVLKRHAGIQGLDSAGILHDSARLR